jgi:hypothetical protein
MMRRKARAFSQNFGYCRIAPVLSFRLIYFSCLNSIPTQRNIVFKKTQGPRDLFHKGLALANCEMRSARIGCYHGNTNERAPHSAILNSYSQLQVLYEIGRRVLCGPLSQ